MKIKDLIKTTVPSRLILSLGTFLAGVIALGNADIKTILIAAVAVGIADSASSTLNSVYDAEIDKINRRNRPATDDKKTPLLFMLLLSVISVIIAASINFCLVSIIIARLVFEYIYSVLRIKEMFIVNHISVGVTYCILPLLAASSITGNKILPIFSYFFALSVFMTPLKDIDDVKGDKKHNVKTLPVVLGVKKAKNIIFIGSILLTAAVLALGGKELILPSAASIAILITLFALSLKLTDSKKQESMLTKIAMLSAVMIQIIFALYAGGTLV